MEDKGSHLPKTPEQIRIAALEVLIQRQSEWFTATAANSHIAYLRFMDALNVYRALPQKVESFSLAPASGALYGYFESRRHG
jgi:hypothetical protein